MKQKGAAGFRTVSGFVSVFLILILGLVSIGALGYLAYKNGQFNKREAEDIYTTATPAKNLPSESAAIQENTDSWVTYSNNKYHYKFKYQKNPIFTQLSCGNDPHNFNGEEIFVLTDIASRINSVLCYPLEGVADIQINTFPGNSATLGEIYESYPKVDYDLGLIQMDINGNTAYKMKPVAKIGSESGMDPYWTEVRVYNPKNNLTYYLFMGNSEFEETFTQILSNFTIID